MRHSVNMSGRHPWPVASPGDRGVSHPDGHRRALHSGRHQPGRSPAAVADTGMPHIECSRLNPFGAQSLARCRLVFYYVGFSLSAAGLRPGGRLSTLASCVLRHLLSHWWGCWPINSCLVCSLTPFGCSLGAPLAGRLPLPVVVGSRPVVALTSVASLPPAPFGRAPVGRLLPQRVLPVFCPMSSRRCPAATTSLPKGSLVRFRCGVASVTGRSSSRRARHHGGPFMSSARELFVGLRPTVTLSHRRVAPMTDPSSLRDSGHAPRHGDLEGSHRHPRGTQRIRHEHGAMTYSGGQGTNR